MENIEKFKEVKTKKEFVLFVYALSQNYKKCPESWHNDNIATFLEALAAWVDEMEGYYLNQGLSVPESPDWEMIANMFLAAKIYE
jgi:hypothetical protein